MGLWLAKLFAGTKEMQILMLGLDAAGKTTIVYKLKLGELITTVPTIGFNTETVQYKGITFNILDIGGQDKLRPLWRHYYHGTSGIIFVVDSADRDRIPIARDELQKLTQEDLLQDCALLILANKQDIPGAMSAAELMKGLNLDQLPGNRKWHIQPTVATSGDGLYEGLSWLKAALDEKRK